MKTRPIRADERLAAGATARGAALALEAELPPAARHRGDGFVEPYRHRSYAVSQDRDRIRRER